MDLLQVFFANILLIFDQDVCYHYKIFSLDTPAIVFVKILLLFQARQFWFKMSVEFETYLEFV